VCRVARRFCSASWPNSQFLAVPRNFTPPPPLVRLRPASLYFSLQLYLFALSLSCSLQLSPALSNVLQLSPTLPLAPSLGWQLFTYVLRTHLTSRDPPYLHSFSDFSRVTLDHNAQSKAKKELDTKFLQDFNIRVDHCLDVS
jgi:hypothetical protein